MKEEVEEFNRERELEKDPLVRINDLVSELGELSKEILKSTDYGEEKYSFNEDVRDEYGDVLYCILSLAQELDIEPERALSESLEKYRERSGEEETIGSGR